MRKIDTILAALIGFFDGILFYFIFQQAGVSLPFGLPNWLFIIILPPLGVLGLFFAHLLGKKIFILYQAAKFFLVGTLNTLIDLAILYFFIWLTGIPKGGFYSLFAAISFLVATTNSYFWNKFWTFEKREKISESKEYFKFLVITAIGLGINVGVASFIVNIIGPQFGVSEKIWAGVGKIIAAFFAFIWNFLASKFLVFKK